MSKQDLQTLRLVKFFSAVFKFAWLLFCTLLQVVIVCGVVIGMTLIMYLVADHFGLIDAAKLLCYEHALCKPK